MTLTHIDLFSGIGGFALAAEWAGFKTVVFCEKDEYCQKVLRKRWPGVPIIPEIRDFKWPLSDSIWARAGMETYRNCGQSGEKARALESEILQQKDGTPCAKRINAGGKIMADNDRRWGSFNEDKEIQTRGNSVNNGSQITLLTGGFPCQPFSVAGKQRGKEDDRYLWPEMFAVIS